MSEKTDEPIPLGIEVIVSQPKGKNADLSFEIQGVYRHYRQDLSDTRRDNVIAQMKNLQFLLYLDDEESPVRYGVQKIEPKSAKRGITRTEFHFAREIDRKLLGKCKRYKRSRIYRQLFPEGTHAQGKE